MERAWGWGRRWRLVAALGWLLAACAAPAPPPGVLSTPRPTSTAPLQSTPTPSAVGSARPTPTGTAAAVTLSPQGMDAPGTTVTGESTATPSSVRFTPQADTYASSVEPDARYGGDPLLRTDDDPVVRSYLLFNVQGIQRPIHRATLRLFAANSSTKGYRVHALSTGGWSEQELSYRSAPGPGPLVGRSGPFSEQTWTEVDVTSLVQGEGPVGFVLVARDGTAVQYPSREAEANQPELVLLLGEETAPGAAGAEQPAMLLAAGDVASCESEGDEATAALLDNLPGTVAVLGDSVYERGRAREFAQCYDPSWGRHRARTRPAVGNHEYRTDGAEGYFDYFGAAAGEPGSGYYSYDLGAWHIIVLNSNCSDIGGCQAGSPQERWLRADLAAHPTTCTLAYWHHARFSSGLHGNAESMQPLWATLAELGVDVVLSGHDHHYERFRPLDANGQHDEARGIRQFVVGTGGRSHYKVERPLPTSEVVNDDTFGILKLTLYPTRYEWEFVPTTPDGFRDRGSAPCH